MIEDQPEECQDFSCSSAPLGCHNSSYCPKVNAPILVLEGNEVIGERIRRLRRVANMFRRG